jgi:hypothetical protein
VTESPRWLLLVHQLPAKPDYLRAKVGRRLARLGAVPLKNSVYVVPADGERREDLEWLLREIAEGGGDGWLVGASFLAGLDDAQVEERFRAARDEECAEVILAARALLEQGAPAAEARAGWAAEVARLHRRHDEIAAIDFFDARRRAELGGLLRALGGLVRPLPAVEEAVMAEGRTWVTRRGVKIDRIASAWLVRRFIDPDARFKFVEARGYVPAEGERRFDMFEAEYSHEGDACTFEVLVSRFAVSAPGVAAIAEIVHDIDLKDERYARPETRGVAAQIEGIAAGTSDDEERLRQGFLLFDALRLALSRA